MFTTNLFKALLCLAAISTPICAMNPRGDSPAHEGDEIKRLRKIVLLPASAMDALENLYANTPQLECEKLGEHEGDLVALDASTTDDFSYVVSGARNGSMKIWGCGEQKACLHTIDDAHVGGVIGLQISKTTPLIMSYGADNAIKVWTMGGESHAELVYEASIVDACWISDQCVAIASGSTIGFWNINTKEYQTLDVPFEVSSVTQIDDDRIACLSSKKYTAPEGGEEYGITVWDVNSRAMKFGVRLPIPIGDGSTLRSINSNKFFIMSFAGKFSYLDFVTGGVHFVRNQILAGRPCVAPYLQDSLVCMDGTGLVRIYDFEQRREVSRKVFGHHFPGTNVMTTLGDGRIVFAGLDDTIYIGRP